LARSVPASGVSFDLLGIHARLFAGTEMERFGGRLRDRQNWIGGSSLSPRKAEFVPPPPDLVPELMEDLCRFVERVDVPAVVQAAIVHAQFETIHPFVDGNGRVGRALVHIVLRRRGTVSRHVPPVSLVLLANGRAYVEGLTMYHAGEIAAWSTRFAHALTDSVALAATLGRELNELQEQWRAATGASDRTSATQRLIDLLAARPVVDIPSAAELLSVSYPQAREAVLRLEAAGVLRQVLVGHKRNRAWEAPSLLDLLDAFESEAMTPTRTGEPRRTAPRGKRA